MENYCSEKASRGKGHISERGGCISRGASSFWKGHLSVKLEKTLLCSLFCSGLWEMAFGWYDNFTWKLFLKKAICAVTLRKTLLCTFIVLVSLKTTFSQYDSSTWNVAMKRPFTSDTREDCEWSLFRSLRGQNSLSQHNSFTWKMVFRRPFVRNTGEDSALNVNCSDLLGSRALWVDTIALLRWWSWKGFYWWYWGKWLCRFILQFSK